MAMIPTAGGSAQGVNTSAQAALSKAAETNGKKEWDKLNASLRSAGLWGGIGLAILILFLSWKMQVATPPSVATSASLAHRHAPPQEVVQEVTAPVAPAWSTDQPTPGGTCVRWDQKSTTDAFKVRIWDTSLNDGKGQWKPLGNDTVVTGNFPFFQLQSATGTPSTVIIRRRAC